MCRALQVLCAAPDRESLQALKLATVSQEYELTGGATDVDQLVEQAADLQPDAVVLDAGFADAIERVRAALPNVRIIAVGGEAEGADDWTPLLEDVRSAVLGIPRPGGPVR